MAVPTKEQLTEMEASEAAQEVSEELSAVQFQERLAAEQEQTAVPEESQEFSGEAPQENIIEQAAREQEEMTRRDREILAALDEVLQKNSVRSREPLRRTRRPVNWGRIAVGTVRKGAGFLSLALTLIFMGVVLVCVMISAEPDYLLIAKLSPIAAVLVGAEMLLSWFVSGRKLRINIPCVCITAVIVAGCCIMSAALNKSDISGREEYNDRIVAAEIYAASYKELRHSADIMSLTVTADLNPDSRTKSIETLSAGDIIEITAVLDGNYSDPREFAAECRSVMDVYKELGIPVMNYRFSAETRLSSFKLDVQGMFQQDLTVEELAGLVRYIYVEDYDYIQDLEDIAEEETETSTSENT